MQARIFSRQVSEFLCPNNSCAFANHYKLVRCDSLHALDGSVCPTDAQVSGGFGSESEVQSAIIDGVKARLSLHLLRLTQLSVAYGHARTDGAVICLRTYQQNFQPMPATCHVVAQ